MMVQQSLYYRAIDPACDEEWRLCIAPYNLDASIGEYFNIIATNGTCPNFVFCLIPYESGRKKSSMKSEVYGGTV